MKFQPPAFPKIDYVRPQNWGRIDECHGIKSKTKNGEGKVADFLDPFEIFWKREFFGTKYLVTILNLGP